VLIDALRLLDEAAVSVLDVSLRRPTLDDVFLTLTGHAAEEDAAVPDEEQTDEGAGLDQARRGEELVR
jgi:ABC-2 type transport system ATP-binding protein